MRVVPRTSGAGIRKPPREETALEGRKPRLGNVERCGRRYGDLSAAGELSDLDRADATSCSTVERLTSERRMVSNSTSDDLWRGADIWASSIVAGRKPASATSRLAGLWHGHEVSILITVAGAVERCRGVAPRSNTSMMITRPPQHGQLGLPGSAAAAVGSSSGFAMASSSRAHDVAGAHAFW